MREARQAAEAAQKGYDDACDEANDEELPKVIRKRQALERAQAAEERAQANLEAAREDLRKAREGAQRTLGAAHAWGAQTPLGLPRLTSTASARSWQRCAWKLRRKWHT